MPRAAVHARRDAPLIATALKLAGAAPPEDLEDLLLDCHRAIDGGMGLEDMPAHFMRGEVEEDAGDAFDRALGHVNAAAARAVHQLPRALRLGGDAWRSAAQHFADATHGVRDSFSRGHARRAPDPGGPQVVGMHAWEEDLSLARGFGLVHVLTHDLRFEAPFDHRAPEVEASDEAVFALVRLIVEAASRPNDAQRTAALEAGWPAFVEMFFLPPGEPGPKKVRADQTPPA